MRSKLIARFSVFLIASIAIVGCDKSEMPIDDRALGQIAMEQALQASVAFTNSYAIIDQQARQRKELFDFSTEAGEPSPYTCGLLSFSSPGSSSFPAVLQLSFSSDCSENEGKQMRGTLKATYSGKINNLGTTVNLEFIEFTFNGIALSGMYSVVTNRADAQGILGFKQDLVAGTLIFEDGSKLEYDETTFSRQIEGNTTDFSTNGIDGLRDDVWEENRTATLVSAAGDTYALTTSVNSRRLASCSKPVSGELRLASSVLTGIATLDYGAGGCDDKATIMYEGKESQVQF